MYALRELWACISLNRHSPLRPVRDTPSAEHLTVNQGVTGSSPVGGAKLKEPRLARGSFNLIPPSEPEPVSLSRDSHKPVGRLTGLDRFSGLNLHLDALLVRTNGLIQGVTTPTRSPQKNHALRVVLLI